ncbi:MAG: cation:proton antiporter [Longimicrobiales bacterium]
MEGSGPILVALFGVLVVAAMVVRAGLQPFGVPALVGYLILGLLVRLADGTWGFVPEPGHVFLETLGRIGVIVLLFRVGLESDVDTLRGQLGRAGPVWAGSVVGSGLVGFGAARWILGFALVPSLFTAVAMTATSVGVSLGVWREMDAISSETGALLVDTVELDDFSGVALVGLLFSVAPVLHAGGGGELMPVLLQTSALVVLKAGLFLGLCYVFARYAERPLTRFTGRWLGEPRRILVVVGVGFLLAALAEQLGFSFAIGAFFAGLVFSRDPEAGDLDAAFETLYELFVPFFFIWMGLSIRPEILSGVGGLAAVLVVAAVGGKVLGTMAPAVPVSGWLAGLAVGISVVPRAEITMVVMERGTRLGDWAVPPDLFAGMFVVVLVTSAVFPLISRRLLEARPEIGGGS